MERTSIEGGRRALTSKDAAAGYALFVTIENTIAVVLAGGIGTRVGASGPKQLLEIAGRPILAHTLSAFQESPVISEIVLMMVPESIDHAAKIVTTENFSKVSAILPGGKTRAESSRLALEAIGERSSQVLFHDAARPLVTQQIITDTVGALHQFDAVTAAIESADTIVSTVLDPDTKLPTIGTVMDRAQLVRVQTPQCFKTSLITEAHRRAAQDPRFVPTDDCSVVLQYFPDVPVGVVAGDSNNIKVTVAADLEIAAFLLQQEQYLDETSTG